MLDSFVKYRYGTGIYVLYQNNYKMETCSASESRGFLQYSSTATVLVSKGMLESTAIFSVEEAGQVYS